MSKSQLHPDTKKTANGYRQDLEISMTLLHRLVQVLEYQGLCNDTYREDDRRQDEKDIASVNATHVCWLKLKVLMCW